MWKRPRSRSEVSRKRLERKRQDPATQVKQTNKDKWKPHQELVQIMCELSGVGLTPRLVLGKDTKQGTQFEWIWSGQQGLGTCQMQAEQELSKGESQVWMWRRRRRRAGRQKTGQSTELHGKHQEAAPRRQSEPPPEQGLQEGRGTSFPKHPQNWDWKRLQLDFRSLCVFLKSPGPDG